MFGLRRSQPKPLRLIAQEAEDVPAIAALLQDAGLSLRDIFYDPAGRHLTLRMNRYCHDISSRVPMRAPAALRISGVTGVQRRGLDPKQGGALSLLDIAVEVADAPAHVLTLRFAGGDKDIRVAVECIDLLLLDLAAPRRAETTPNHSLD